MSTKSRRSRGRPPRTPLSSSTNKNRTNFLRKPKAYQDLQDVGLNSSRTSSPVSTKSSRSDKKGRGRAAANRGRQFLSQIIAAGAGRDDDDISSLPEFEHDIDRGSDLTDLDNTDVLEDGSDVSFLGGESEQELSDNESLSTVSSSVSRKRLLVKRPKTPEIADDKNIPVLDLPDSATDLLLPAENVLQAIGVYEVLRHFKTILRLSPFTFEDFCACLLSEEQSNLQAEIHITLLRALLREEESSNSTFGPQDLKDSVNISLFHLDSMTWPEIVRAYLDSEKHPEFRAPLSILEIPDYPYVPYGDKLKVLQTLTDLFLAVTKVREEIINEGNILYDDHCRACHKLGDLLCCETCSAVYHLACVEPPMHVVPEDDWICSVCRIHQVKGVTDCLSEAEKSGFLCRQEPIGYDRHARKYWFLCRRIIVEDEKEIRYYTTKYQLEELLEALDSEWEYDLITFIIELKEDIIKQMAFTEELTNAVKGSRKTVLEIENTQLIKLQAERALAKAKEEEEQKAKEEEQNKKKQEEKKKKEAGDEEEADDMEEQIVEEMETSEVMETEAEVTSEMQETTSTVKQSTSGDKQTTEEVKTTTTTTTVTSIKSTTTTTRSSPTECNEPPEKIPKLDTEGSSTKMTAEGDNSNITSDEKKKELESVGASGDKSKEEASKIVLSSNSALAEAIKASTDGKPKVINLQSLLPAAKQALLNVVDKKNGEEGKKDSNTKTVLLVNREGGKVTLQVQRQPVDKDEGNTEKSVTNSSSSTTLNALETKRMTTRMKTGSLTPKIFTDSVTLTTTSLTTKEKINENILSFINKEGDTTKVTRGKVSLTSSLVNQSLYFKLGAEASFKQFQNQYATNTLALNKHQHNEDRDKRRHLSHKFSLTDTSHFKWNGVVVGNKASTLATLRNAILTLESIIQTPFMHINWQNHRENWKKAVQMCQSPRDFALALTILEACIKPCVFNHVWHESLGHLRLKRITIADREEWKKKEQRKRKEDEDTVLPVVWIKYTRGLKHQVWKQKGEEYRVTGGIGWQWISVTRVFKEVAQDSVGLRLAARRLKNRKIKASKAANRDFKSSDTEDGLSDDEKMESDDCLKPEGNTSVEKSTKEDFMEVNHAEEFMDVCHTEDVVSEGAIKNEVKDETGLEEIKLEPNEEVNVKTEKDEIEKKSKAKSVRGQRKQTAADIFLAFVKEKYYENKDNVFALELLKQHPPKVEDVEVINVSDAIQKHKIYPKVTKPYSKLDNLLERRMKQDEFERKQRMTIEAQIAMKTKLNKAIETAQKKLEEGEKEVAEEAKEVVNGELDKEIIAPQKSYSCYSVLCRTNDTSIYGGCYSPACRSHKLSQGTRLKSSSSDLSLSKFSDGYDFTPYSSGRSTKEGTPSETISNTDGSSVGKTREEDDNLDMDDEESSKDGTEKGAGVADASTEEEEVDIEGDISKDDKSGNISFLKTQALSSQSTPTVKKLQPTSSDKKVESSQDKHPKGASVSDIVKNLVLKTMAEKAAAGKGPAISAKALDITIEELEAKLPPKRSTTDKVKLAKFTKINSKKGIRGAKQGRLPMCHKFETSSKKKSILVLDRHELIKMARQGSKRESVMFNYNCKMNNVCWPYPCPRPVFKTAWRYRTMTLTSIPAAALQLRIIWGCIRWDDMATKAPAGGTNTVSTETEITTTELLKRREIGVDGLRSQYLVRKIVVPLGVQEKPKEKYTPQRSGLRQRKQMEEKRQTEPSVAEVWIAEEVLELWEIKQFGEKLEKQRIAQQAAEQEKAAEKSTPISTQTNTVNSQQSPAQIKAQMEQQLKQQRLALAQKRIQENQGGIRITSAGASVNGTVTTVAGSTGTTIIINNPNQPGKPGGTFKTLTVSSSSSLLSSGIIKTMQPKTIQIANSGSLLGSQIRPGIRVQIPGSALQLRPQTVTLAPKPGSTANATSPATSRLISPATSVARIVPPSTTQVTKSQTIQIKPASSGQPVQNLHFVQTANGQLQVRGLLPGQIIQRMPDGKLQIITMNNQATTSASSSPSSGQPTATSTQQPRPVLSIRPQQPVTGSTSGSSTVIAAPTLTQNRLVIPAQLASSGGLSIGQNLTSSSSAVPAIRQMLGGTVVAAPSKQIIMTRPGGPQIISAQNLATVLGSQPSQILSQNSGSPLVTSASSLLNSAVVISAPGSLSAGVQSGVNSVPSVSTVLVNASPQQSALLTSLPTSSPQTIISTLKSLDQSGTNTTLTSTLASGQSGNSLLAGQVVSGTSLLQRPPGATSLLNLNTASGTSSTLTQIPKVLTSPPAGAQIITRPAGSTHPQLVLRAGTSVITNAGQAKVITAQQLRGLTNPTIQLRTPAGSMSPIKSILNPQSSLLPAVSGAKTLTAVRSLTPQLLGQTPSTGQPLQITNVPKQVLVTSTTSSSLLKSAPTLDTSPEPGSLVASLSSPTAGTSPSAGAGVPKYAVTPQVVEQVVRQALLQNQTPEIQQKLLAMQKQIQQQQTGPSLGATASPVGLTGGLTIMKRANQNPSTLTSSVRSTVNMSSTAAGESLRSKLKGLTFEQKEEQSRVQVCTQVMKSILDRIEKEEKQEQRNKKKQESAEEKNKRMMALNQQRALFKHKESLKKEIHRKRSLMEKNLQQEIYNEMSEKVKKVKSVVNVVKSPPSGTAVTKTISVCSAPTTVLTAGKVTIKKQVEAPPKELPVVVDKTANRKRKQKIISTGPPMIKGLNPKERLYCVCKTPYDETKFYIGCDLCSNWFHGACVNINESQANYIDSYICEDCRKQQENTSEELYCLCRTPYDENKFYIGCDRCQDWFHGYCVGISKDEADDIEVYVCPNCQKEEVSDPIAQKPLTQSEYQHLNKLLKDLQNHKMSWPFLQPVDPRQVPDYYDIVSEPMDLTIVDAKLGAKAYSRLNDFVKDVTKIFDNCRLYNPVGTPYFQCAEVVETYFAQKIKSLRSAHKL